MKKNVRNYKVNGMQYAYILDAICPENTGISSEGMSDTEKVLLLLETFAAEKNYPNNFRRFPNAVDRLADWMQGLPSVFNIAFTYCDIIQQGKAWGYCKTEKQQESFCEHWFSSIACKTFQLARILGIDTAKY